MFSTRRQIKSSRIQCFTLDSFVLNKLRRHPAERTLREVFQRDSDLDSLARFELSFKGSICRNPDLRIRIRDESLAQWHIVFFGNGEPERGLDGGIHRQVCLAIFDESIAEIHIVFGARNHATLEMRRTDADMRL